MSFDASSYSSLGRRRLPSYSLSSGSSRSSFSADYGSSSNHGFSPGLSSLGSTTSLSTCGLSSSMFSSRPPSSSSFSSRSSREGSFLSASMMKRDTIINSLVRTSHDLTRHDFLPADAASRSSHISHRSYRSVDRSRSKTADLTLSSLTARSSSDFSCFSSFATTSTYGTTYRSTYRPILIQRPTFDNYTPRPRDERQRDMHSKSIRRDRPLVKFREKEDDTDPEQVRQLLDSWSPETIEELDDEDYETKKRDSVRSNDSGIGSFRSSFGKRSRKKSGEFLSYDLSPTIDERDSGTEDNEDLSSDKRYVRSRRVDHISSVDEGVHMEAEYESRSPRDIVSPLGFQDSNGRPLSRNDVLNTFARQECVQSVAADERPENLSTSIQRKEESPSNSETKPPIIDRFSRTNNRVRRRSDFDGYETLENTSDAVSTGSNRNATNRRRDLKSRSNTTEEGTKIREMGNIQTSKDAELLASESEKLDKTTVLSSESNVEKVPKIESFDTCVQDRKSKGKTEIPSNTSSTSKSTEKSRIFPYDHKFTIDNKAESMKPHDVNAKLTSKKTDETTIKKMKFKKDSDEEKKTQILSISLPPQSEASLSEAGLREKDSLRMSSGKVAAELLRKTTADSNEAESLIKMPIESHSKTVIGKLGKIAVESPRKTEVQKPGSISTEPTSKTIEYPTKSTIKSPGQNTAESLNKLSVGPFSKTKTESLSKTKIQLPTESATTETAIKKVTESSDKTSTESSEELKIRTLRTEISGKMPVESSNKIPSTKPDKITCESSNKKQPESPAKSVVETSNSISVGYSTKTKTESQTKPKTEAPSENTAKTFSKPSVGPSNKMAVDSLSKTKDESFSKSETHSTSKAKIESLSKTTTDSRNKTKAEPLSKTAIDSISKMEVESLNKTATDSYSKTKVKTLDKLETDSPSKTKIETLNKTAIDSPSKTKVESLNKAETGSPSKTEAESLNKTETESHSKTKVKTFDKTAIDSPSKTKIESLRKTTADSPSKTEIESLSKTATEPHSKRKVKTLDKTATDLSSTTKVESLGKTATDSASKMETESLSKTAGDSPSKTEVESLSKAATESHSKTKVQTLDKTAIDLPSKTKVESLSKTATDSPSKTETKSLNKTATESPSKTKIKTFDKTATDSPSKIKVEPLSKMTTDSHNKTKVESFNKSTIDSPIKTKDEPFSKRTTESAGKKTDLPHKLATSTETDSAFQTDVKPALLMKTGKVDVHGIVSDGKSNNEEENLKVSHKLTKDSGETTGAIPKTKRENFIKTDTLSLDRNKRCTVDSDYILPTKKDEKQFKCSESSVSQAHECNEVRSKNSSSKTEKSVSFSVSEISNQKDKDIKTGTAAKSEVVAAKSKLPDNKADNTAFEKDTKLSISLERTATEFSDLPKLNSKTTDITTPSHSQNTDKCLPSLPDAKQPLIRKEKEKSNLRDTERKDKFNIDRPERKATAEKNVLSSDQQVLKGERSKELLVESVNKKPSRDKEIASFEKDVSLLKTGEGVHKDVKKSPETTDTKTDKKTQKQIAAAFIVSSESSEDSKTQARFPVPSKVTDFTTQGKVLSVSEKSLSNDVTSEKSVNQLKNNIDSTSDTKDVKFSKTYSSERKKSAIEEAPINDDSTKENVDSVENKIATPQNISASESRICASGVEKKFEEELSEKSTNGSKYQRNDNSEACDSKPVVVETSDIRPQTERKRVAFAIQKSSSEDFRYDNSNTAGETSENFKLQKSSSAGTKAPKRTKPPLPAKTLIPSHVPALEKETSKADDLCLAKNIRFHQLQKYSTEGKMDFKGDHSNERSYDLKKSSTAGKINFKDDSSESSKLYDLKKSNTTECNRIVRKPPIRGNRILGKPSQLTEQKVQAKECVISVRISENSGEIARLISVDNKSSEIGEKVLKSKEAQENIPKENKENLSAKGSTTEGKDRSNQTSEVSEVAPENEGKLETVKVGINADANQQIISDRPGKQDDEDSPVIPIETARGIEQLSKDTGDAVTKTGEAPIPLPRVARPYVPKNRLVPSKSDSNVPMRQLMTSSSAPNIAIEKVREKIAKNTGLSEHLSKIPAEKQPPKSVQDIKEKDLFSAVDDSCKTHQLSDKNRLVSQGKEPQEKINLKVGSEISQAPTGKSYTKSEFENASESVIPSREFKELQGDSSSTEHHTNAEISVPKKVESEKETAPKKKDSHPCADNKENHAQDGRDLSREKEISKESLANEVPSTRGKEQAESTVSITESVEARKLKTDSSQKTELHTVHSEKLVTAKILAKCIESQQIVTESSLVTTKSEPSATAVIPILKGRSEDDTTSEIISNAVPPPKKDAEDTAAVDSKTAEEETKPKVKKAKKPKVEGEEKVKKKKKKKEKLEVTEEKSEAKKETVESSTKENTASGKTCEEISASEELKNSAVENIHSKENSDLSTPSSGVNNEASATTDTYSVNICNLTPPQSPAISDTEDLCDQLWNENKRSESSESFRQSRNSGTIRFKKYSVEDFHFLKVLGRGSYGKVMLSELKGSTQYFAVKCLKKDVVLEDNDVECTMIEKKVLAMGSSHPYLCTLFCTFQSQSHLFFVMEYLSGGDLMFHIQQSGRFDQERAKFYAAEIVCALKYLHKRGIVYRDAKLDNICLDSEGHIRLVDFGFCKLRIYRKECLPRNLCGTPDYMAPEIIKGHHYNQSVDWWSFGVLLYEMLIGQSPFNGTDEEELFWSVCNEEAYYPRFLSKEAKHLLVLLLEKNPEKRLGMPGCVAGDICHQPFFKHTNWEKVEKKEVEPPFKPKLKSETDVSNFDSDFTMEKALLTPIDKQILDSMDQSQFQGFSYTNPRITD